MFSSSTMPLQDYYVKVKHENTLVFYKGAFTEKVIAEMNSGIKKALEHYPYLNKKVYSIFIELAQNIGYYSAERNILLGKEEGAGVGTLVITETPHQYTIVTGNLVKNTDTFKLVAKCETINTLNRDELRAFKRRQRNQPSSYRDNGNIGLIQVALLASSPFRFDIKVINNAYSFFSLAIDIHK